MNLLRQLAKVAGIALVLAISLLSVQAQVTTGNVRGVVKDPNGAVVPNAKVTITDPKTRQSFTTQTTSEGEYQFNNLPVGQYEVTVEAANFNTLKLTDVRVELNQTTDLPTTLSIGVQGGSVTISAGGAELVDTTTTTLSKQFSTRQVVDLALTGTTGTGTGAGAGINNLSLLSPGVTSNGGVGVGVGGSVGGQRPRNNNFVVDGIDNNDKAITGPQIYVSPETVAEFSLLTNQYSAEFARSTGGQFITVTKSGTNEFHGSIYDFVRNRKLNALDTLDKNAGVVREDNVPGKERQRRYDYNRYGFNLGGPLYIPKLGGNDRYYHWSGPNKLFFFTSLENLHYGFNNGAGAIFAPTAAGLATIAGLPGINQTNFGIFKTFVPVARTNDAGTIEVAGTEIPIGSVSVPSPFTQAQRNFVLNLDFTQSQNTQHRSRFIWNRNRSIDNLATFPQFFTDLPQDGRLFSYTMDHNFTSKLTNELRLSYRRYVQTYVVPNIQFPGLDQFPNITLEDLGGPSIGPDANAPQSNIENNYQIINNVTYLAGNHSMKFGGDFRVLISPQVFVQRQRGDYDYDTTDEFLRDVSPGFAERNVGANTYYGNQKLLFLFAQDDWRFRPNLTFNLGLNYAYQQLPLGARQQSLNAISSVPGLIEFRSPKAQKKNFAPRVGLAYSPSYTSGLKHTLFGENGQSSIRASFQMAYDVIFDNLYILSSPPQFQQTIDVDPGIPNFLKNGGIGPNPVPSTASVADIRAATSAWIPDQEVPYSISYSLSYQRQFMKNYSVELRYLGSRGVHLLTQNRINIQPKVFNAPGGYLPTFFSAPTQAQLDALTLTLSDINARPRFLPNYAAAGFNAQPIVGFLSNGNSTYHGGSIDVTRRFTNGMQFTAAYTLSHLIDDTTAEVFSTVLTPRRVQDFQNLRPEKADSALDRRHRFVFSGLYDLPFFRNSSNGFVRTVFGGFSLASVLTFESGEKATVLSGVDANLNGDRFADRAIVNPNGVPGTSSTVTPLTNTAGKVVGYLANNPNAQYIEAGLGALANGGRNTLQLPGINNLDLSVFKNFRFGETRRIQLRADFYNAFNHPQYTPGSVNSVDAVSTTAVQQLNNIFPGTGNFNQPGQVFSSHPRIIQMALRFDF